MEEQPSVCYVQAEPNYASIPIDDDPIYTYGSLGINNISVPTSAESTATPRITIKINGLSVKGLVDSGAGLSAIRSSVVDKLNLSINEDKRIQFNTAANQVTSSSGIVQIRALPSEIPVLLICHVVSQLAHEVIIDYPDLKSLRAIIDTVSGMICISQPTSTPMPTIAFMCRLVDCIVLPAFHHTYVDIKGPANILAFVSTPADKALEKLLSVAAGVVEFNKDGIATVKVANLDNKEAILNKGQCIVSFKYLQTSPELCRISDNPSSIHSLDTHSSTVAKSSLDFSRSIGEGLSVSEGDAMNGLLGEFSDCFNTVASSVTPLVQHSINTGDHRPISQPPHRTSAAENETISTLIDEMLQQGIVRPSNSP